MYFLIEKQSTLGQQICCMMDRVVQANQKMLAVAAELSDLEKPRFITSPQHMCGVFYGIEFASRPGKEWAAADARNVPGHYYHPSAREHARKHSEIVRAWNSIEDKIELDDLNALFGLQSGCHGSLTWYRRPGMTIYSNCYILEVPAPWASSVQQFPTDMIEILESEAIRIKNQHKSLHAA